MAASGQGKEVIFLQEGQRHSSPIPEAVKAGGLVFLSAVRGVDPATQECPEDPEQQARFLFENMKLALAAAGSTIDDVVKIGVFMRNLQGDRPVFNKIWQEYFGDRPPARFAVQVGDLGTSHTNLFLADVTALAH
jgi:2-iminobutanoate/2-iminopropanoate deaminase